MAIIPINIEDEEIERVNYFDLVTPGMRQIAKMNGCDIVTDGSTTAVISADGRTRKYISVQEIKLWVQNNQYGKISYHIEKLCEYVKAQNIKGPE